MRACGRAPKSRTGTDAGTAQAGEGHDLLGGFESPHFPQLGQERASTRAGEHRCRRLADPGDSLQEVRLRALLEPRMRAGRCAAGSAARWWRPARSLSTESTASIESPTAPTAPSRRLPSIWCAWRRVSRRLTSACARAQGGRLFRRGNPGPGPVGAGGRTGRCGRPGRRPPCPSLCGRVRARSGRTREPPPG